jgi:hypothetical protein
MALGAAQDHKDSTILAEPNLKDVAQNGAEMKKIVKASDVLIFLALVLPNAAQSQAPAHTQCP